MALLKICVLIIFYFLSRVAMASCETYTGPSSESICWDHQSKSYISERCLKKDCDAKKFLQHRNIRKSRGTIESPVRPAKKTCHELQLPVVVYKDPQKKDVTFCLFNDGTLLDTASIQRFFQ